MAPVKVAIVGSGAWGSAISRIVGENAEKYPDYFDKIVKMWVFEEIVDGKKLSEIINNEHENVKYLPGKKLPNNVVAVTDLVETVADAGILIFVIPHQFINKCCSQMAGKISKNAIGVSLIKGLGSAPDGSGRLISSEIHELLGIEMSALMGANLAHEVADDQFCEATIGAKSEQTGSMLKKLFHTKNFRVCVVPDADTVEVCGALKNIVACGAGFSDGLGYGDNTKAAIIRLGLMEMIKYIQHFHQGGNLSTYFESCGVADLVTTCHGGRNRKCSEAFVKTGKSMDVIEKEMLGGQKLQGPETAAQAYKMIQNEKLENQFPLFVAVHKICIRQMEPKEMIELLKDHPAHM